MKDIRGHKSRNQAEIIEILMRHGAYTCPDLPHYRYDRVKAVCRNLLRRHLVAISSRDQIAINFVATPLFREWQQAHANGETALGAVEWVKHGVPGQTEPVA